MKRVIVAILVIVVIIAEYKIVSIVSLNMSVLVGLVMACLDTLVYLYFINRGVKDDEDV